MVEMAVVADHDRDPRRHGVPVARYSVRRQEGARAAHQLRTMRDAIDKYKQIRTPA
jgi:hypothetical protein